MKDLFHIFHLKVFIKASEIARDLGIENPMLKVVGSLANIRLQMFNVGLEDEFPEIGNPYSVNVIPDLVGQVNQLVTQTGNVNTGFIGQNNITPLPNTNISYDQLKTTKDKIDRINTVDSIIKG